MKVVALMSFYDETDEMLRESIMSLEGLCDALVAVDGAYALYPGGKPSSGGHEAIRAACEDAGLELELHVPDTVWLGNECEKREFMFRLGEKHTEPSDWFFIVDGDFVVGDFSDKQGARRKLSEITQDVASVTLDEQTGIVLHPLFFRAIRGIEVGPAHHYWKAPDGRWLWHPMHGVGKYELYHEVIVEHRQSERPSARAKAALAYYATRDRAGIEVPVTRPSREERRRRRAERRRRAQKRSA